MSSEMKEQYEMDKEKRERVAKSHGHRSMPSTPKPDIKIPPQRSRDSDRNAWHQAEIERLKEELEKEKEEHNKSEEKRIAAENLAANLYSLIRGFKCDVKKLAQDYKDKSNNLFFLQVAAKTYNEFVGKSPSKDDTLTELFQNICKPFLGKKNEE